MIYKNGVEQLTDTVEIKSDIFEAIRVYEKSNSILKLKDDPNVKINGSKAKNFLFESIVLWNGKICALPSGNFLTYYRGESKYYDSCIPSIYRENPTDVDILINRLKLLDFIEICKTFPSVISAEKNNLDIRYDAIAQHYGLKTDLIDLTSDIVVAAFFATHTYNDYSETYSIQTEGNGVLRSCIDYLGNKNFEAIGVQPFLRTSRQAAFGRKLKQGEDFATSSSAVVFRQDKKMNERFSEAISQHDLFCPELIIEAANTVRISNTITLSSIKEFCALESKDIAAIKEFISRNGYDISIKPVYILNRNQRRKLERGAKKDPFGGIKFTTRAIYFPP